jgi:hypothetical protein
MKYIKTEFEKKLKELTISYKSNTDGSYILYKNNSTDRVLTAQLILSESIDEVIHGSRNNNKIQAIGLFKLKLPMEVKVQDFLILAFQNTNKHCANFIIIPTIELMRRLNKENRISIDNHVVEIVFWLMPDNQLYETTDLSVEGEWYYLSKGLHGRMADQTEWDYTEFLNNWNRIIMV